MPADERWAGLSSGVPGKVETGAFSEFDDRELWNGKAEPSGE
jgi:hypothetical protein